MPKDVIMPALGMAQETGTLVRWLKAPGDSVAKGEPLMEVETDKATVEVEAPASGVLSNVTAQPGDVIPVGHTIALLLAQGESASSPAPAAPTQTQTPTSSSTRVNASPIATRLAAEHNLDLAQIKPQGGRVQKEDVLAYLAAQAKPAGPTNGRTLASPKARRLALEQGVDLKALQGSGPQGAILAADVLAFQPSPSSDHKEGIGGEGTVSRLWRIMADRVTQAWTTIPHFYLLREVNASRLISWRAAVEKRSSEKITYTDLLVKLAAAALRQHPRLNAAWKDGDLNMNSEINICLAVAVSDGLLVPVIRHADQLDLSALARRRAALLALAQSHKLMPDDLSGGTFTISNLGMYGVDAFNAIVNPPQAAILAVGRIADRVVPLNGQPAVQPMLTLSLSCDHRALDGARGAQFLQTLADLIEEPILLLE